MHRCRCNDGTGPGERWEGVPGADDGIVSAVSLVLGVATTGVGVCMHNRWCNIGFPDASLS